MDGDAVEILEKFFPDESLSRVNLFFPDPWHKARHHKRRIVQPKFLKLLAKKLVPGGIFHAATDWENYAEHMMEVLSVSPYFFNLFGAENYGDAMDRPETKFERRGLRLGHGVWDLAFIREKDLTILSEEDEEALDEKLDELMEGMMDFKLDPILERDSIFLGDFPLSQCRLMNAKEFPWLLLIPRREGMRDWTDLNFEDQLQLQGEINQCARVLRELFPSEKLNIASLGNIVSQLHIHIVVRNSTDIAWPKPVWGVRISQYSAEEISSIQASFLKKMRELSRLITH
jgi:diadenosine tetraphosphate (Ap4A) HIT family hydrolase